MVFVTRKRVYSKGDNSFDRLGALIDLDYGVAGGHHHLVGEAYIFPLARFFFCRGCVKGEKLSHFILFCNRNDELEGVKGWPDVKFVKLITKRI